MDRLYAPWRSEYVKQHDIDGCVFCHIANSSKSKDEELGVLYRGEDYFIVMNKYPYSPGHFMIVPNMHTSELESLDANTWQTMAKEAQKGVKVLKDILNVSGVNLGMNLGKAGGAGIAEHIHLHLVPRWIGDTNFITTISDTRVFSVDFDTIYRKLKEAYC